MGREIKRVALDFNWPIGFIWKGYQNPYRPIECKKCLGSGLNEASERLERTWYDLETPAESDRRRKRYPVGSRSRDRKISREIRFP